jgi:WD40 repeat protein
MTRYLAELRGRRSAFVVGFVAITWLALTVAFLWWILPPHPWASWKTTSGSCCGLVVSANGRTLIAINYYALEVWEITSGEKRRLVLRTRPQFPGEPADNPYRAVVSPDGHTIIYGEEEAKPEIHHVCTKIWKWKAEQSPTEFLPDARRLRLHGFTPDSKMFLYENEGRLYLWDLDRGKPSANSACSGGSIDVFGAVGAGPLLATETHLADQAITVWDVMKMSKRLTIPFGTKTGNTRTPVVSGDGHLLASVDGGEVKLWDLSTGRLRCSISDVRPETLNVDGTCLFGILKNAEEGREPPKALWNVGTMPARELGRIECGSYTLFSPDGHWFASMSPETIGSPACLNVWDSSALHHWSVYGAEFLPNPGPWRYRRMGGQPRFAPDSRTIANQANYLQGSIGHEEEQVRAIVLWDVDSGLEVAAFPDCSCYEFFPDGKSIATFRDDGLIQLWDLPPRRSFLVEIGLPSVFVFLIALLCWFYVRARMFGAAKEQPKTQSGLAPTAS